MSMFDRPVDDRRLGDGQQLVRSDWRFEPALRSGEARWDLVARLVWLLAWAGYLASFLLPLASLLPFGGWMFVSVCVFWLLVLAAASWRAALRARRAIHVLPGHGFVFMGGRKWRIDEIVGVALDLDESTTRHAGAPQAVNCRVALVLWEHLGKEFTRVARTAAGSTDASSSRQVPSSVIAAAAERALDTTTILSTHHPAEAQTAAAGLASNLGVPVVEP